MLPRLCIESDFRDYYDYLSVNSATVRYIRKYSNCKQKGIALNTLKKLGVTTINIGSVKELSAMYSNLVVYTDVSKHRGDGKQVMSSHEAKLMYHNNLASPYYDCGINKVTNKFLQIGERRFRLTLENVSELKTGRILEIDELYPSYNYLVGLPVFSIDYINTIHGMLAVDFNEVQELGYLGIHDILKPEEIILEIYKALITYKTIT